MSRFIANAGGQPQARTHRFAEFVFFAIEAAESIKALACRWAVPEESLRRWRDGSQSPAFDRLLDFHLSDDERLVLCRILGAGRVKIEPLSADEADRIRQNAIVGTDELQLRREGIALSHAANKVQEVIHEALADGQVDEAERGRMEQAVDSVQASAGRCRPGFSERSAAVSASGIRIVPDPTVKHIAFAMIWTVTVAATAALVMTDHPAWAGIIFGIGAVILPQREEKR